MCSQAPWPVRKGIFRSTGQSDFVPTRTPSPIVEFPLSPPPPQTPTAGSPTHHKNGITLSVSSPTSSPRVTLVDSPLATTPTNVRTTFEIPIERVKVRDLDRVVQLAAVPVPLKTNGAFAFVMVSRNYVNVYLLNAGMVGRRETNFRHSQQSKV